MATGDKGIRRGAIVPSHVGKYQHRRWNRYLENMSSSAKSSGSAASYPVNVPPRDFQGEPRPADGGPECFDTVAALELNRARFDHLQSLELPWEGKAILDVGCGVGHLARTLANKGHQIAGVDAREENIRIFRQRHPELPSHVASVEEELTSLGVHDVLLCYGLLYHLENPFRALRNLAAICRELLVVETIVCDHELPVAVWVDETKSANQALLGLGCRPSPSLVALALNRAGFPLVYGARHPPAHPEFEVRWNNSLAWIQDGHVIRSVFIASRKHLGNTALTLLCGAVPSWCCSDYEPGEKIPGALLISERVAHNATEISGEGLLTLVSPRQPWAYSVAFPLHPGPQPSQRREPILLKAGLRVHSGEVRFGAVTTDLSELVGEESALSAADGAQQVELVIAAPDRCGWIVFRNGEAGGPCRFEIHNLAAYQARKRL
jgi:2-polyprenyl-3-methyl-5-hydroxy-6-metoxy-1,4-benzoquinol methylase